MALVEFVLFGWNHYFGLGVLLVLAGCEIFILNWD
jgi:hypothetical protein